MVDLKLEQTLLTCSHSDFRPVHASLPVKRRFRKFPYLSLKLGKPYLSPTPQIKKNIQPCLTPESTLTLSQWLVVRVPVMFRVRETLSDVKSDVF